MKPIRTEIGNVKDPVERLCAFIREREAVRLRKVDGKVHDLGLTQDPILAEYRFCNVRREDDRVTRWIAENWRAPGLMGKDTWFAMVVARFINWPETLENIGFPVPWRPADFLDVMEQRRLNKVKVYSGAYMTRADPDSKGVPKPVYQERAVFTPMWEARERLRPKRGDTLNSYHVLLGQFHGLGSFMAAQVVADLKYVSPLREASDWWTFAALGPGSRRGLNRVLGRPKDAPWTEEGWRAELARKKKLVDAHLICLNGFKEGLHAQDLQNCLCEFDKYERVRLGQGRPRARYRSHD